MIEFPDFHDSESSAAAFILIIAISATTLVLLPSRDRREQLFWIIPCVTLSLIEVMTDVITMPDMPHLIVNGIGVAVVSAVLARRAQSSLGQITPIHWTLAICGLAGLSLPIAGLVDPSHTVHSTITLAGIIAASCWPMATPKVLDCIRLHRARVLLFSLILVYAVAVLSHGFDQFEETTPLGQLETSAHFLGVLIGSVASGLALRQALRENEQLVAAERSARLAQEETNRFLRALIDTTPAAIYVKDLDSRYCMVNRIAAKWARRSESEVVGRADFELFPPEAAEAMREHDLTVVESGSQQSREISLPGETPGALRTVMSHKCPLLDAEGNVTAIVGLAIDITQMRAYERDLIDAKFKAEEASRSKSNFLAHMSHELRTPLNAIIGFSDVIQRGMFGQNKVELYQQYAADIHQAGNLLLAQVNDLLDISRIEAGTFEVSLQPVQLGMIAEDCRRLLRDQADRKGVTLVVDPERPLPKVVCDRRATLQVLINLVGNAIKYVPQGSRITIAGGRTENGVDYFIVEDNGPGLPTKVLQALLDPWTHQSAVVAEDGRGGMGLILSRKLMEAQSGRLFVESSPGKGTRIACQFGGASRDSAESPARSLGA